MKLVKKVGATSEIWQVFIMDTSKFDGSGLTGLTNASITTAYYHRDTDTTATSMSLVSMTVGTFTSLGFKEIDSAHMPGWYQFCPPNAALASGAKSCAFYLAGAANMGALPIEVQLTAVDPDSATAFITGVNSVAPPTNWNLMSVDASGRVDTAKFAGQTITAAAGVTLPSSVASPTNITAGTITTVTNLTNAPSAGDFTATMKTSLNAATPAVTVSDKTGFSLSSAGIAAVFDLADGIETSLTPRQAFRLMSAALAGKLSGATTTTIVIRNTADTKDRITATVDTSGNRTAVTYDLT